MRRLSMGRRFTGAAVFGPDRGRVFGSTPCEKTIARDRLGCSLRIAAGAQGGSAPATRRTRHSLVFFAVSVDFGIYRRFPHAGSAS
jgi:hypothetical protein